MEYLEGLDHPVLKWSLPDNSHVCLASESTEHREHSRDIAVGVGVLGCDMFCELCILYVAGK